MVGREVLGLLLLSNSYDQVITPVRNPADIQNEKLQMPAIDYDDPPWDRLFPADHVYCCLGTTIKKAGSQTAFRKVDQDYPLAFARIAKVRGTRVYSIITAMGSNPNSSIFYNRVKGEVEKSLDKLGFSSLVILRPSLLLGARNEFRLGEKIGSALMRIIAPLTPLIYRGIQARSVAGCMVAETLKERPGTHILKNNRIHKGSRIS